MSSYESLTGKIQRTIGSLLLPGCTKLSIVGIDSLQLQVVSYMVACPTQSTVATVQRLHTFPGSSPSFIIPIYFNLHQGWTLTWREKLAWPFCVSMCVHVLHCFHIFTSLLFYCSGIFRTQRLVGVNVTIFPQRPNTIPYQGKSELVHL